MKNLMIKVVFPLVLVVAFFSSSSQTKSDLKANFLKEDAFKTFDSNEMIGNGYVVAMRNKGYYIKGTTYFIDDLLPGKVRMFKKDDYMEGLELRYNIFFDRLEVQAHDVLFAAINKQIAEFVIESRRFDYHFYNSTSFLGSDASLGYLRAVHKGEKFSIFAKDVKLKNMKESRGAYSNSGNSSTLEFVDRVDYYVYDETTKELSEVKSSKKLVSRFPVLREYGSITKSDLKDEYFLAEMGSFMNQPD